MLDLTGVRIEQRDLTVLTHEEHESEVGSWWNGWSPSESDDDGRRSVESGCKHSQRSAHADHDAVVAQYEGSPDVLEVQRSGNDLLARDVDPDSDV